MTKGTDIPKGYKQTKVGVIPEDWEVNTIGKHVLSFKAGISVNSDDSELRESDFGVLKTSSLSGGKFIPSEAKRIVASEYSRVKIKPQKDTLMVCRSNAPELVGECAFIDSDFDSLYLSDKLWQIVFSYNHVSAKWISFLLNSHYFRNRIKNLATGTSNSMKNISKNAFRGIHIPLPSILEQKKIATILSTWDKSISTTQSIIDELKLRNKGLAQQLLTGKKRLKGFDGEWIYLRADNIFKNHTDKSHNGEFEVLSATQERGVIPRSMNNIDIKFDKSSLGTYKKVEVGNYVISLRSFQGGIEYSSYEGLVSPAYTVLKEALPISKTYYRIYFKTETFINRLNTIIYGIRDGKQISYKDFSTLRLPYPSLEEQNEISRILEQGNQELNLYKMKLDTLKDQKKGLMQKLLTGEIRVTV